MPDGHVTDMVNLTRAWDAAVCLALGAVNEREAMTTLIQIHTITGQCIGHLLASRAGSWRLFDRNDVEIAGYPSKDAAVEALNRQQSEAIAA